LKTTRLIQMISANGCPTHSEVVERFHRRRNSGRSRNPPDQRVPTRVRIRIGNRKRSRPLSDLLDAQSQLRLQCNHKEEVHQWGEKQYLLILLIISILEIGKNLMSSCYTITTQRLR
jgi:hypothetical protein